MSGGVVQYERERSEGPGAAAGPSVRWSLSVRGNYSSFTRAASPVPPAPDKPTPHWLSEAVRHSRVLGLFSLVDGEFQGIELRVRGKWRA